MLHDTASGLNDNGSISWLTDPASKVSLGGVLGWALTGWTTIGPKPPIPQIP